MGGAGGGWQPRPFCVGDAKAWGDHKRLELAPSPAAYKAWRQRALDFLSRDKDGYPRPEVRELLLWTEGKTEEIDAARAMEGAHAAGLREPVEHVAAVLYGGIRSIISDAAMQRSERCSSGLELWRRLHLEMRGSSTQIAHMQASQFQSPARVGSLDALWDGLQKWEALGSSRRRC